MARQTVKYSRKPNGVAKLTMSVTVPTHMAAVLREKATESQRTISDVFSECLHYWLDSNYPDWDIGATENESKDENEEANQEAL